MKLKSRITLYLCATLLALPSMSSAFSIVNATKNTFTVSINHHCSTEFGNVPLNRETVVSDAVIKNLCQQPTKLCKARIYPSENCNGLNIGSFAFDQDGVVKAASESAAQGYSVKSIVYMNLVAVGQH